MDGQDTFVFTQMPISGRYIARWAKLADIPELIEIDKHSGECLWSFQDFRKLLRDTTVVVLIVSDLEDRPVAFLVYEVRGEALNILNLVVHPEHRRQKIGTALISNLKSRLREDGSYSDAPSAIFYDVRETNVDAQLFLRANGLIAYKVEREYFKETYVTGTIPKEEAAFCFRFSMDESLCAK